MLSKIQELIIIKIYKHIILENDDSLIDIFRYQSFFCSLFIKKNINHQGFLFYLIINFSIKLNY